jgi:integrase/recombinase XerD
VALFLGRSPDTAAAEERRAFQLHLTETGVQQPSINATVTALRFFFKLTLDRPETTRHLVFVYEPRKLPRVLSPGPRCRSRDGRLRSPMWPVSVSWSPRP